MRPADTLVRKNCFQRPVLKQGGELLRHRFLYPHGGQSEPGRPGARSGSACGLVSWAGGEQRETVHPSSRLSRSRNHIDEEMNHHSVKSRVKGLLWQKGRPLWRVQKAVEKRLGAGDADEDRPVSSGRAVVGVRIWGIQKTGSSRVKLRASQGRLCRRPTVWGSRLQVIPPLPLTFYRGNKSSFVWGKTALLAVTGCLLS